MKNRKVPAPKTGGVARVPSVIQMENMECGAACLAMVLAYYGRWEPLTGLRELCGISRDGAKMSAVAKAARKLGLEAQGYRYEADEFFEKADFPCIVHWNFTHFVVVRGRRGSTVYINDPGEGSIRISLQEFSDAFTGVCIRFKPGENFQPSGKPKGILSYLRANLKEARSTVAFVTAASLVTAFAGLLLPGVSRVFLDRVLSRENPEWIGPLLAVMGVFCLVQLGVGVVQAVWQMKLFGVLGIRASTRYMWHLFHMPAVFFFQRQAGDLQQNEEANRTISETFITRVVPLAVGSVMMAFYALLMARYSLPLTVVGLAGVGVNLALSRWIANRRINIVRIMKRDRGRLMTASMAGVSMIDTIKAAGAENAFFGRWSGYQAGMNDQNVRFEKVTRILGGIPDLVSKLTFAVLLCAGVGLVIRGQFTVGCVVAFQAYLTAFMQPALQMVSSGQMIQEMRTDMERIEDVMAYPEARILKEDEPGREVKRLQGDIEISHVTFGYAPLEEPLMRDLSLRVRAGTCVAVTGASGCGKTTLLSLVSGLYAPWEGEIRFDGRPLAQISRSGLRASLAVIEQDAVLFQDTIANNIRMWDRSIEDDEVIRAAKDAHIHEDIMARPAGYESVLREGGADFSGGQKQRIEIARALAGNPSILIMDEATSALDAVTEAQVVQSVRDRGMTCLIVAHRLSTIRDCDRIIVLDRGQIAEEGTHEELMAAKGLYYSLVSSS